MNIATKITIPVLLLFLSGCAHNARYYSDDGIHGSGVNSSLSYLAYPLYNDHSEYGQNYQDRYYGHNQYYTGVSSFFGNAIYPRHSYNRRAGHYTGGHLTERYFPEVRRHNRHINSFVSDIPETGYRHRRRSRGYRRHDDDDHH